MNIIKNVEELLLKVDCRIENEVETKEVYLTIIDREKYPRLWIDNDNADEAKIISESVENILLKSNPFLEKDWKIRFVGYSIEDCINQYNNDEIVKAMTDWCTHKDVMYLAGLIEGSKIAPLSEEDIKNREFITKAYEKLKDEL